MASSQVPGINYSSDPRKVLRILLNIEDIKDKEQIEILSETFKKYSKWQLARERITQIIQAGRKDTLKPEIPVPDIYKNVRDAAIKMLSHDLCCKLDLLRSSCKCTHEAPYHDVKDIPHDLFSWSYNVFLSRRKVKDISFAISIMSKNVPKDCLEQLKFHLDYISLQKWLERIFAKGSSIDSLNTKALLAEVRKDFEFLDIYDRLKYQIAVSTQKVKDELTALSKLGIGKSEGIGVATRSLLEEQLNNMTVWYPIELRYHRNHLQTKFEQYKLRCANEINAIQDQIDAIKDEITVNNFTTASVEAATNHDIEEYKQKYNDFKEMYERELDEADYEITTLQRDIAAMKETRSFQKREMIRFQKEIAEVEALKEKEAAQIFVEPKKVVKKGCFPAKKKKGRGKK